jgi:hypothetical protein
MNFNNPPLLSQSLQEQDVLVITLKSPEKFVDKVEG